MRIAVFCGSSRKSPKALLESAWIVGQELGRRRHTLIYGGGRTGLMGAVADGTLAAGGVVHGIILREFINMDVHHPGIDELTPVDDMRSRKAGLDERADAFIALPGGYGTLEEITEILSFRKLGHHHRTVVLLNVDSFYDGLIRQIERGVAECFDDSDALDYFRVTEDPRDAVDLCETSLNAARD
ncbi:MAG: TIGR00730 family Rossman fold protein [Myxococcales bacterium]|nr:TIGR00730 family Rossman fold protein [Myxococcales bacterium]